jgi:elongation factor G
MLTWSASALTATGRASPRTLSRCPTTSGTERPTRTSLIEKLADFDDELLEKLLEEVEPSKDEIYQHLTSTLKRAQVVPVFLGSAFADYGIRRLWKALRHETPGPQETAARRGIPPEGEPLAQVIKTYHLPHTGKLSLTRVWRGTSRGAEAQRLASRRSAAPDRWTAGRSPRAQLGEARADPHGRDRDRQC